LHWSQPARVSQWLFGALAEAGLPAICVETRHMRAVLQAQINKTDRNDARGMAQMMRAGLYRPAHVKTLRSQKLRMLLTHRKLLQSKAIAIDNDLRGTLRNFGLKVGVVGASKFEARIKELTPPFPCRVLQVLICGIWRRDRGSWLRTS
jgi:transposase